ncbi:hypothetical protein L596_000327 [Steinernema carpocapsae]|uniref:Uncharacterized protein n=1 Tax=Steinernema carpocapsae TaxID=34508 RepID=A0A4U8UK15_STECR|nr:hypothetical protein L596_000327 [Steinernema carpocapsae]
MIFAQRNQRVRWQKSLLKPCRSLRSSKRREAVRFYTLGPLGSGPFEGAALAIRAFTRISTGTKWDPVATSPPASASNSCWDQGQQAPGVLRRVVVPPMFNCVVTAKRDCPQGGARRQ